MSDDRVTATLLSDDEMVRRLKAAMAEAGYPDARVRVSPRNPARFDFLPGTVPPAVAWKAAQVVGLPGRCRACFLAGHEPCASAPLRVDDCGASNGSTEGDW